MTQTQSPDHDQMYQTLANEILRFELKPGDALSENQLCQRFGLSRTPVRSLLQRLQENGLVQIIPCKGSIVTRLDYDVVNQLIYERVAVETMVLRDFIRTCSPADAERTRYAFSQLKQMAEEYFRDPEHFEADRFRAADLHMHESWFRATGKEYLWRKLSSVESSYTRFCMLDIIDGNNVHDVLSEHEEMLRLIHTRSEDGLEELMKRHLYGGVRRLSGLIYTRYADFFVSPADQP